MSARIETERHSLSGKEVQKVIKGIQNIIKEQKKKVPKKEKKKAIDQFFAGIVKARCNIIITLVKVIKEFPLGREIASTTVVAADIVRKILGKKSIMKVCKDLKKEL